MSNSANDMPHMNYKIVKDRMLESSKGFWKVKSIHTLISRLQTKYNPNDFLILNKIKRPDPKLPSFIRLEHGFNRKNRLIENQKNFSSSNLKVPNFFITSNIKKDKIQKKKQEIKNIFDRLFRNYTYEPFLYNDCQFFYLQKEPRLLPRKFNDVIKDCLALKEYENYINSFKRKKDEIAITGETMNAHKNLSYIGKQPYNDLNIINNTINPRNRNKNDSLTKKRAIERKCFSSYNIGEGKKSRAIILRSENKNDNMIKRFHSFRIKSVYKSKDS